MIAVKGNENKVIFHMNVQNQAMVYHTVMIGDLLYYTIRPKFFYPDTMNGVELLSVNQLLYWGIIKILRVGMNLPVPFILQTKNIERHLQLDGFN